MLQKWTLTKPIDEISHVVDRIVPNFTSPFCLWLEGEPGAGKTTLTRFLLQKLGLDPRIPVQSPTYTYLNEYKIKGKSYAHMDLYRVGEDGFREDLEWIIDRQFHGYIIEWPSAPSEAIIPPTHKLEISTMENSRNYTFYHG